MMSNKTWLPSVSRKRIVEIEAEMKVENLQDLAALGEKLGKCVQRNKSIHEEECINLNPATNLMNPRAEGVMAMGLSSRPSLGYVGLKYEMGLEAIEEIEVLAEALARKVFKAKFAELRVASGAIANLYVYMAATKPGDTILVQPNSIAGHVTHHKDGAAGLYGLNSIEVPVDSDTYTVDLGTVEDLVAKKRPKLIILGGSLNLSHHPVKELAAIAHDYGAKLHFDASHLSGVIAGGVWPNPLDDGADCMTMSCYKSLAGPASGLILTNDETLAERLDAIAYPGMTANFDVGKTASLAYTLIDWLAYGKEYAKQMIQNSLILQEKLLEREITLFLRNFKGFKRGGEKNLAQSHFSQGHAFALMSHKYAGGRSMANILRRANLLSSGIALPCETMPSDDNGLRIGTNEVTRLGMKESDMHIIADFIQKALEDTPEKIAKKVTEFRRNFRQAAFTMNEGRIF